VRLAEETRQHVVGYCEVTLALVEAGRGRAESCHQHAANGRAAAQTFVAGSVDAYARAAEGLLAIGLGDEGAAIDALAPLVDLLADDGLREPGVIRWAPDLIEAYARAGRDAEAHECLSVFSDQARATARPWALAASARCDGLLASDDYDSAFARAIELERAGSLPFELARSELCWGERLRRSRRRGAAREHLRHALSIFERLGARGFAERARTELRLAGGQPAPAHEPALSALTVQELQIALQVARGATNRQVAGALFLSVKTIEAHLHTIYAKLGMRSRTQLAVLVASTRDVSVDPATDVG
jgi:DNA-binding NarL/FixJ family response regulator